MKIALHLARTTRALLTAVLLLAAVALSVARFWLLPEVDAYRQQLQTRLSKITGQPLRIGGLSAHMRGFYPELVLSDVAVADPASGAINVWLGEVHVGLDLPGSLSRGEWRTGWVSLQGADLSLHRRADGAVELTGLQYREGIPPWLFGYGRFELQASRLRWSDEAGGVPLELANTDLLIVNDGSHHHLAADLTPVGDGGQRLRLVAELDGDMERPASLAGRVYLRGQGLRAETWPLPETGGYALRSGTADVRLWLDWRDERVRQLAGWAALTRPSWRAGAAELSVDGVEGRFRWRRSDSGWSLEATHLRPNLAGNVWPESRVSLTYEAGALRAAADYARLDDITSLLRALALEPGFAADGLDMLLGLNPRGELRDLSLAYETGVADGKGHYGLCATFKDFGLDAYQDLPGAGGLSGRLCGSDSRAWAELASGPGQLDLPRWFRAPLAFAKLDGRLSWRGEGEAWVLSAEGVRLEAPGVDLNSRFTLARSAGAASPVLDWRAEIERGDVREVSRYLPARLMPEDSVAWLDGAFQEGRITAGTVDWHGALADFPFAAGEGSFRARAEIAGARLRFAEGWQALSNLSAQLSFDGDGLEVSNGQGMLGEAVAEDIGVRIDHMAPDGRLLLAGRVRGDLRQVSDYFLQTPKAGLIEKLREHAEAEGNAAVDLLLAYDFGGPGDEVDVRGEVRLSDGRVKLPVSELSFEGLNGTILFDNSQLESDQLHAALLGDPVTLALSSDSASLSLSASGNTTLQKLKQWRPAEIWNRLNGKLGYRVTLKAPWSLKTGNGLGVEFSADLAGAAVELPPPFGKALGEPGDFHLSADWEDQGGIGLRGEYSGLAKWQTRLLKDSKDHWGADSGELALGEAGFGKPLPSGWRVSGHLDAVPLNVWWELFAASPAAMATSGKIRQVELSMARPNWEGREWGALSLTLNRAAKGWDGYVESAFATGAVRLPPSAWPFTEPMSLDLERIILPDVPKETLQKARQVQLDPGHLPALAIRSQHLMWHGHDLGRLDCQVERKQGGLRLTQCALESELQKTGVSGEWWREGAKDFSRLDGKMKIKDLGRLLSQLGQGDDVVETPAKLKFALQWQDAPQRVAMAKLNGDLAVSLGEGALRHLEPGIGRALGLFNIETLRRRLLLDFSDVFDEGLAFDKVSGDFKISDGVADTRNLFIDGPSARIFINGKTDLSSRTLDQLVTVVPRTSLAWPVVGTLAGGPAVGAAMLLAQQLVGDRLEGITASQYSIKGGWDEPAVTLLSRNTPMEVLQRAWQGMKDVSKLAEPEESVK